MKRSSKARIAELELENKRLDDAVDYCTSRLIEVLRERDELKAQLEQTSSRLEYLAFVTYRGA